MSSKNSKKLLNIILSAFMLLAGGSGSVQAGYGVNGVSYVLLPTETADPGVFRLNNLDGSDTTPWKLFKITNLTSKGKVSGLAANQENKVFLLTANNKSDKDFKQADPGWLPIGIKFDDDSAIYIAAAGPSDKGADKYIRNDPKNYFSKSRLYDNGNSWYYDYYEGGYTFPHGPYSESFPSDNSNTVYKFWFKDATVNGVKYKYVCRFNGPKGVCLLDGDGSTIKSSKQEQRYYTYGVRGTPIWDGEEYSSSNPQGAIKHPKYSDSKSKHYKKIILPSHFGALSYYLYGTRNEKAIEGKCMNGEDGRDKYEFYKARCDGYFYKDEKHANGTMFACIVKRFYDKRESGLDLYSKDDPTVSGGNPKNRPFNAGKKPEGDLDKENVLKTVDVRVREAYGKICGDNCIDGGEIAGGDVETALSTVTVVTTTKGNRYGFNPLGERKGSSCSNKADASLRVVPYSGSEDVIDIAKNAAGTQWGDRITNKAYLNSKSITPNSVSCIGVSSNFTGNDYIYGSGADYFVVQDSWWGMGGVAYEYYKASGGKSGFVRKIDYMNQPNQTNYTDLGDVDGDLDAIGIDGNGYFYTLVTEKEPSDNDMKKLAIPSGQVSSVGGLSISYSEWRRDKFKTVNGEKVNDGFDVIDDGKQKKGDYRLASIDQNIYKTVYKYAISNGTSLSSGSKERVGTSGIFAGYDKWTNNLTCLKDGTNQVSFSFAQWQPSATKVSDVPCELAVVNIADSPQTIPGTDNHYVVVTGARNSNNTVRSYGPGVVYQEHDKVTFKVEGYKPKIGSTQRNLTSVGDISSSLKGVYINNIPGETFLNGRYEHDEDKDGFYSGFPSTMFEASGKPTRVTWKIAQVEDTVAPARLSDAKIIKYINLKDDEIKTGYGIASFASLEYQFKDPGRYLVQATVEYNIFTNYGKASRPDKLEYGTASFVTKPRLITVYANNLKLDETTSFISDITLTFDNKMGKYDSNSENHKTEDDSGVKSSNGVKPKSGDTFDTAEGEELEIPKGKTYWVTKKDEKNNNRALTGYDLTKKDPVLKRDANRHFGDIKVSFNAQFVREINAESNSDFITYDGIGVWDYKYYRDLYLSAKTTCGIDGLSDPIVAARNEMSNSSFHIEYYDEDNSGYKAHVSNVMKPEGKNVMALAEDVGTHVYNYIGGILGSSFNKTIYNPGKEKEVHPANRTYLMGTEVNRVKPIDKAFIQWALYLRPVTPQGEVYSNDDMFDRGDLIANGTCASSTFTPIKGEINKYKVSFDIKDVDSKINIPRDPKNYTLDFEIIYPRVTWLNNQLTTTPSGEGVYYSSIIPYSTEKEAAPIHVLSRLKINGSDISVNQSSKGIFSSDPYFTLNIRDRNAPVYNDTTVGLPYYETTGDKNNVEGVFKYRISDNNPFMQFVSGNDVPDKSTIKAITKIDAESNGLKLWFRRVGKKFENDTEYSVEEAKSKKRDISITQTYRDLTDLSKTKMCNASSDTSFYSHNDYELSIEYLNTVNNISNFGNYSGYKTIEEIKLDVNPIDKSNWTGDVDYAVTGYVYDGMGIEPYREIYSGEDSEDKEDKEEYGYKRDNTFNTVHGLYDGDEDKEKYAKSFTKEIGNDKPDSIIGTGVGGNYLKRIDNDPPSLGLTLISQTDNRKWNYQLLEGIGDKAVFPSKQEELAETKLLIKSYNLQSGSELTSLNKDYMGSTNNYLVSGKPNDGEGKPIGDIKIGLPTSSEYTPSFKHSSRMLINVDIFDNCGFKDLASATIVVKDIQLGNVLLDTNVNNSASHNTDGKISNFINEPRGTFAIDLPSKVATNQPQVQVNLYAKDKAGNEKELELFINLVESTFDTRVLETKENKLDSLK